jgi:hypothetical protein
MRVLLTCFLLAAAAIPAHAQYTGTLSGRQVGILYAAHADDLMSQMIQQPGWTAMRASVEAHAKRQAGSAPAPAPGKAAYKLPITATDFKPAGERRVPEQLAEGASSPRDRQDLAATGKQILRSIEDTPGFRQNNLAAALSLLVGVSVQVLSGTEISEEETDALTYGLNDQIGALPAFQSMSAGKRTQAYDTFVVIGGYIAGIFQEGVRTGNRAMQEQARAMARDALSRLGVRA